MQPKYSRNDENKLPKFHSHFEAREYFKSIHGKDLQLVGSDTTDGEEIYYYDLLLDKEVYYTEIKKLNSQGFLVDSRNFINSFQRIEIWESGVVHILH